MRVDASPDLDDLLASTAWLQRLARRICGDAGLAEDLAQNAVVAALTAPAAAPRSRRWLAGVVRNLWRQHRRRERPRRRREGRAAPPPNLPSTAETVARLETQRRLATAVLELAEPERSAVVWHYLHELPIATIAARLGVHPDTIRKRVQRGLATLRARLAGDRRDRRGLLALAAAAPVPAAETIGAMLMTTKHLLLAAGAALVAVLCWTLWPTDDAAPVPAAPNPVADARSAAGAAEPSRPNERVGVAAAAPDGPAAAAAAAPRTIAGRLVDFAGRSLSAVWLASSVGRARAVGGAFELQCGAAGDRVTVDDPGWVAMYEGDVGDAGEAAAPAPVVVVAAPRVTVGGRVVDGDGGSLAGVKVAVLPPPDFLTHLGVVLDRARPVWPRWQGATDEAGRFSLADVGAIERGTVTARAAGFLPATAPLPAAGAEVELVLRRPPADAGSVLGQVLDLFGMPVAGAAVGYGAARATTDERGMFRLDRERARAGANDRVHALRRGLQPASAPVPPASADGRPPFVELWLRSPTFAIAGVVVDRAGRPVEGARVWADGAELLRAGMWRAEAYLGGGATNAELRARHGVDVGLGELQERHPTAFWGWVETAADGSFRLEGLAPRNYVLGVLADGLRRGRAGPFAAGASGVRVLFDPPVAPRVAGRIVGLDGRPRAGIAVEACCRVFTDRYGEDGPARSAVRHGPVVRTGDDGAFEFRELGTAGLFLAINGAAIVDRVVGLHEGSLAEAGVGPLGGLEIAVADRTHLQVALADPELADGFRVLDAADNGLQLANFEDGGMTVTSRAALTEGRSRVYAVASNAAWVVLLRGDAEVTRVPVTPVPGEVVVVRR